MTTTETIGQITFREQSGSLLLGFPVMGGLAEWQEFMADTIDFLPELPEKDLTRHGVLFSYQTGRHRGRFPLSLESSRLLATSSCRVFYPIDAPPQGFWEYVLIKTEKTDDSGYFLAGLRQQALGDWKGAAGFYDQVLTHHADIPRVFNLKGLCLRLLGKPDEAEQAYLKEIALSPEAPDAYCNLGLLYRKTERTALAQAMFEKALEVSPFYWNGLLQLGKLLFETQGPEAVPLASINQRLFVSHSALPQVQEYLAQVVQQKGLTWRDYENGLITDPAILLGMKKIEDLRQNGAFFAATRAFFPLLQLVVPGRPSEKIVLPWLHVRLAGIRRHIPELLLPAWERIKQVLLEHFPMLLVDPELLLAGAKPADKTAPTSLTSEEFMEVLLQSLLQDGQIRPDEVGVAFRVKNALKIDDTVFKRIFAEVESSLNTAVQMDDGRDFVPLEVFRRLVLAVTRDGIVEPGEKKLLEIAREALNVFPQDAENLMKKEDCP